MSTCTTERLAQMLRNELDVEAAQKTVLKGMSGCEKLVQPLFKSLEQHSAHTYDFCTTPTCVVPNIQIEQKKNTTNYNKKRGVWSGGFHADGRKMLNIDPSLQLMLVLTDRKSNCIVWIGIAPMKRIVDEVLKRADPDDIRNGWTAKSLARSAEDAVENPGKQSKMACYNVRRMWDDFKNDPEFQVIWAA